jgi:hypothetical protein
MTNLHFPKIYYYKSNFYPKSSGTSVPVTSQVRAFAILLLLIAGNQNLWNWEGSLQCYNVHTAFHENWSNNLWAEMEDYNDGIMNLQVSFTLRTEIRLRENSNICT